MQLPSSDQLSWNKQKILFKKTPGLVFQGLNHILTKDLKASSILNSCFKKTILLSEYNNLF